MNEQFVDDKGTVWMQPTAWAYHAVCKALEAAKQRVNDLVDCNNRYLERARKAESQIASEITAKFFAKRAANRAWLIELHRSDTTIIKYAYMDEMGVQYTTEITRAIRLCRRDDAEDFASGAFDGDDLRIVQYEFDGDLAARVASDDYKQ